MDDLVKKEEPVDWDSIFDDEENDSPIEDLKFQKW